MNAEMDTAVTESAHEISGSPCRVGRTAKSLESTTAQISAWMGLSKPSTAAQMQVSDRFALKGTDAIMAFRRHV